ncbi:MAG: flagellar biosynthesis protein FliQ [Acidobacteria bacterium]|nr:flagellar biosynthesis protein FliQ [Acidobacteriota bacterium]
MNQAMILKLAKDTLEVTLMVSGPLLVTALVVGLVVSITQVVTSIQDMTLSFVPRIIAVLVVFLLALPWMMNALLSFTTQLFSQLGRYAY